MSPNRPHRGLRLAGAMAVPALFTAMPGLTLAQSAYPDRPVRMLVGFAPGGGADTAARPLAQRLSEALGQQFVVDNRPGAGGNIATEIAARSVPDGHTLIMGTIAALAINPAIYPKLGFDPVRDFAPITNVASSINVLVVHPSVSAKDVRELVALARARQGGLNYGSSGVGSAGHLAGVLMEQMTGARLVHVPYKGGAPAMTALLGGEVQAIFSTAATAIPQMKAGKIRGLAVTTAKRAGMMPDVPTIAEAGVPGYASANWWGLWAPGTTPSTLVRRLNAEIGRILQSSEWRERLASEGAEPLAATPEVFSARVRAEIAAWRTLARESGFRLD